MMTPSLDTHALRPARESLGLSVAALAARLGIHAPRLSEYELGGREVPPYVLLRLAGTLGELTLARGVLTVGELGEQPLRSVTREELAALRDVEDRTLDCAEQTRALRRLLGVRTGQLAQLVELPPSRISELEGGHPPSTRTIAALSQVVTLHVTPGGIRFGALLVEWADPRWLDRSLAEAEAPSLAHYALSHASTVWPDQGAVRASLAVAGLSAPSLRGVDFADIVTALVRKES